MDYIFLNIYSILLSLGCSGMLVYAGEVCYTDYYTREYCEHGCCGQDVTDRYCCTENVELGMVIGCSVGGGVLLLIIIIIITLLCKCNHKTKDVHPDDNTLSSISEQTGDSSPRCDTICNNHFPGVIHVTPRTYTKTIGLNSHVIQTPCCCGKECSSSGTCWTRPPVFPPLKTDREQSYSKTYSPTECGDIPEILTV